MTKRYRMLKDSALEPKATAGAIVYAYAGYDYGLASDDTEMTGITRRRPRSRG
jgi:hypothetical protein